jgi:hypothetical protein
MGQMSQAAHHLLSFQLKTQLLVFNQFHNLSSYLSSIPMLSYRLLFNRLSSLSNLLQSQPQWHSLHNTIHHLIMLLLLS